MPDLLIELLYETIPAHAHRSAAADLQSLITNGLVEAGLTYGHAAALSTPRRLTLAVEGILATQPIAETVAALVDSTIGTFAWPTLEGAPPALQNMIALVSSEEGPEVVALEVAGIIAGNTTFGHAVMAPEPITVSDFEDYTQKLKRAFVVLSPEERTETIRNDAANLAFAHGLEMPEDQSLLAKLSDGVEYPVTLMGRIDDAYLDLPAEILQTVLRADQSLLSLRNPKTDQIEKFVTVMGYTTPDGGASTIAQIEVALNWTLAVAKQFLPTDPDVATSGAGTSPQTREDLNTETERATHIAAITRPFYALLSTKDGRGFVQSINLAHAILTQAEAEDGVEYSYGGNIKFAEAEVERALFYAIDAAESKIAAAMKTQDFAAALQAMMSLRDPLDAFFDAVPVHAENATVRRNRLNVLSSILRLCTSVADLTKIKV